MVYWFWWNENFVNTRTSTNIHHLPQIHNGLFWWNKTGKNVKTPSIPTKHDSNTKALKSSSDKDNQDAPKIPKRPLSAFFRYAAEVRSEIVQKNQSLKYSNYIWENNHWSAHQIASRISNSESSKFFQQCFSVLCRLLKTEKVWTIRRWNRISKVSSFLKMEL